MFVGTDHSRWLGTPGSRTARSKKNEGTDDLCNLMVTVVGGDDAQDPLNLQVTFSNHPCVQCVPWWGLSSKAPEVVGRGVGAGLGCIVGAGLGAEVGDGDGWGVGRGIGTGEG